MAQTILLCTHLGWSCADPPRVAINAQNKRIDRMEASLWIASAYHQARPMETKIVSVSPKWLFLHSKQIAGRMNTCPSSSLKKSFLNSGKGTILEDAEKLKGTRKKKEKQRMQPFEY